MEIPFEFAKACKDEFNGEVEFTWNPWKKLFQCIATERDGNQYVLFYVCDKSGKFKTIDNFDIQRIRDARTFDPVTKAARCKEVEERLVIEKAEKIRKQSEHKKTPAVVELVKDMKTNQEIVRALARDYSRNVKTRQTGFGGYGGPVPILGNA